jgi:hypothetical protein
VTQLTILRSRRKLALGAAVAPAFDYSTSVRAAPLSPAGLCGRHTDGGLTDAAACFAATAARSGAA